MQLGNRRALVESMFSDAMLALRRVPSIDQIFVVTSDPVASQIAAGHDTIVVEDTASSHSEATQLGIVTSPGRWARHRALLVPGDCPLLDPAELEQLITQPVPERSVLIVPDRHGEGTNALLLTPPDAMTPAFGEGSRKRHTELAIAQGPTPEVVGRPVAGARHRHTGGPRGAAGDVCDDTRPGSAHARHAQPVDAQPGRMITAIPLEGLPEIAAGADLGDAISKVLASQPVPERLRSGDVLAVAHKVVSKAEGRVRSLSEVVPSDTQSSSPASAAEIRGSCRWCSTRRRRSCAPPPA